MAQSPFSFQEVRDADGVPLASLATLAAADGVELAYRCYAPAAPRAALLFYHGGGAHSGASYQHLAHGLQSAFDIAVYMPDLRGHGASGGARGDAPGPGQVWQDVTTLVKDVRARHPQLPLFLGGHSSGAGLTLNYSSRPDRAPVEGYVFLAPEFGFRSKTGRPASRTPFASVNVAAFVLNALSGGRLSGHAHAVRFNYPAEVLAADPSLVASNTVNLANAITPAAPQEQFAGLDRPFGLWIGEDDELLSPDLVLAFADLAPSVRADSAAARIAGATHLSILLAAHTAIGPWLERRVSDLPARG